LDHFQRTGTHGWTLKNNLLPIDTENVQDVIKHIRATTDLPVPSFNLSIRTTDLKRTGRRSTKDLAQIRYRSGEDRNNRVLGSQPRLPKSLECVFDWQFSQDLHRDSWMSQQSEITRTLGAKEYEKAWRERLRKFEGAYARAFLARGSDFEPAPLQ
jgi:hypothetical protein